MQQDELHVILQRLETAAARSEKVQALEQHVRHLEQLHQAASRDREACGKKLGEWVNYYYEIVNLVPLAKRKCIPKPPSPLIYERPF